MDSNWVPEPTPKTWECFTTIRARILNRERLYAVEWNAEVVVGLA